MSRTAAPAAIVPDRMSPLPAHLAYWAGRTPDEPALTFLDYLYSPDGIARTLTWAQLDRRVTAAAARLQQLVRRGERVALLAPQGLEYVVGFLGALRAGVIAVPLFTPDLPGHGDRLAAVVADAEPACVATTTAAETAVRDFLAAEGLAPSVLVLDADQPEPEFSPVELDPDEVAYLQYTSGSTRTPSGVMISHRNVVANTHQGSVLYGAEYGRSTLVSWLPLFHDMGLVLTACGGVVYGIPAVFTDPVAFLLRPVRWLEMLSRYPGGITAAPNFAFDYCAKRIPPEERAGLRLENADLVINAAEPVLAETLDRFAETFAPHGLRRDVLSGAYGLAEATVLVTCWAFDEPFRERTFDVEQLSRGIATTAVTSRGQRMVACGGPENPEGAQLAIVDPDTRQRCPDGRVGEIWVTGPNVSAGYWKRPEDTAETFGANLDGAVWLRSGDLGVLVDGDLYVTGRIKDLIILDGRNHYPQDVEVTVEDAHPVVGRHRVAAFSVPAPDGEAMVVVAEVSRHATPSVGELDEARTAIRRAVSARHGVPLHDVVLVDPNDVPRTSSGKIARSATRDRYLAGSLVVAR
ncbi:fatty acyl-AMP ligase [Cryptosporangium aurantiacum]|uniref:Acyl-CoA synthetase (AMP-forming)/AMP-acid ligase II n=1 Tax=Cryptosporangium aurantiacum TaxID=134849 RepID=A0A1M7QF81_9ACTN|nr:fatty acyl-AMP ligase [Cryptosporangium aurantiacum]SHN29561.1 Acyl-CoA synthetase (AMP-forming)/AMP-acid ligase II [Cryptosporangium aurantiacum]